MNLNIVTDIDRFSIFPIIVFLRLFEITENMHYFLNISILLLNMLLKLAVVKGSGDYVLCGRRIR